MGRRNGCFQLLLTLVLLSACSTNPATGKQQFTALMSPQQEVQVGAEEHQNVLKEFGLYPDQKIQAYVQEVGAKVSRNTERPDVRYKFFLLDSPIVNAFALPGGYIYTTRGLLSLANSEAELAAVLAHETGHITARHSAERYSRSVVTMLGAAVLSSALGDSTVSDALGMGTDLYIKSYSRGQENEADSLGIRYLSRVGYDPRSMSGFLRNLQNDTALEARLNGQNGASSSSMDYFSTHPATQERVAKTITEAGQYPQQGVVNRDDYLMRISGITYGESASQGFVRGQTFYHPELGFQFTMPSGFHIMNQPQQVIGTSQDGSLIVFDFLPNTDGLAPLNFLQSVMLKGRSAPDLEKISINGFSAATASFNGTANGKAMVIRLIALAWGRDRIARFQLAYPSNLPAAKLTALRSATYSFGPMSETDRKRIKPYRLITVTSKSGDTVASMAQRMPFDTLKEDRFRVLNAMGPRDEVVPNRLYKVVVE